MFSKDLQESIDNVKNSLKMYFDALFFKDTMVVKSIGEVSLRHDDPKYMEIHITTIDEHNEEHEWVLKPVKKS